MFFASLNMQNFTLFDDLHIKDSYLKKSRSVLPESAANQALATIKLYSIMHLLKILSTRRKGDVILSTNFVYLLT